MALSRRQFVGAVFSGCASFALTPLTSFASENQNWTARNKPLMGTFVEIAVKGLERQSAFQIIEQCFYFISTQADIISNWQKQSIISKINDGAEFHINEIPPIVKKLLTIQARVQKNTNGLFNPTIGALTNLWRDAKAQSSIPNKLDIKYALKEVLETSISVTNKIRLQGLSGIDVGGIGKGLLADLAIEFLKSKNIKTACISASGDLRFLGSSSEEVSIEHPRSEKYLTNLIIPPNYAVSTSGDYRNTWQVNQQNYHHLIDPRTGVPARANMQVTVVAPTAVVADGLASALFMVNKEQAKKIVSGFDSVFVLGVDSTSSVWKC